MAATTRYPVVLVHGVFGYGRERPLWNKWAPYWPETALASINSNVIIVDVGAISSDHDRACELFFQLYGGTVDYGQAHAQETGHARFGRTYDVALHPTWSASNPVHLVGHSMGSTTAIELYQLVCDDAFGLGTDHRWVRSITCIAGPLTGTTITHLCGLHGDEVVPFTFVHWLSATLGVYFKLYELVPTLRGLFDLRMDQWKGYSLRDALGTNGRIIQSQDLGMFLCQPARRIARNSQLKHMDKLFLMSIATSPRDFHVSKREVGLAALLTVISLGKRLPLPWSWLPKWLQANTVRGLVAVMVALVLWRRSRHWNFAKMPSMYALTWLMRRRAKSLHMIYDGFDPDHWQHNDGAVNIHSMLRPWFPKPQELAASKSAIDLQEALTSRHVPSTNGSLRGSSSALSLRSSSSSSSLAGNMARCASHISIDGFHREADYASENEYNGALSSSPQPQPPPRFNKGRWYVYRVDSNHLAGTHWDKEAGDLYKSLFTMIADEYEREPQDMDALAKPITQIHGHGQLHDHHHTPASPVATIA